MAMQCKLVLVLLWTSIGCRLANAGAEGVSVSRESTPPSHENGHWGQLDPDTGKDVVQIVQARGYHVQTYSVITHDSYILTLYRLPRSHEESSREEEDVRGSATKPVVLLVHGLLDSSFTWVCNYRNESLAYLLADAGYDVWLANNRGTTWSRGHLFYKSDDPRYWNFSWEEMAMYDLPATVDFILQHTAQSTLSYVGHSEGTMQAIAAFSENQSLARKVSFFGALAPAIYVGHVKSPVFRVLSKLFLDKAVDELGNREFFEKNPLIQDIIGRFGCAFAGNTCDSIINAFTGPSKNVNVTRLQVYLAQTPAGTSVKNMAHFAQGVRDDTFRKFDYGCYCSQRLDIKYCPASICQNKVVYGQFEPPAYNLSNLAYPRLGFYTGIYDWLATPEDVARAREELPPATVVHDIIVPYNHLDFTWGFNAKKEVYLDLMTQIRKYKNEGYSEDP